MEAPRGGAPGHRKPLAVAGAEPGSGALQQGGPQDTVKGNVGFLHLDFSGPSTIEPAPARGRSGYTLPPYPDGGTDVLPNLDPTEARIIGTLMEKSVVTPDQYPLTLNALTNACNQKSARDPVMSLDPGVVQHTARGLRDKNLVHIEENFKTGQEKYKQRLCNTTYNDFQFDAARFAIVCLLLLRGPQTPGELRARSGRLHTFAHNEAVVDALNGLMAEDQGPAVVVRLPRTAGRKDSEYMHLFSGPVDVEARAREVAAAPSAGGSRRTELAELVERVERLEAEVEALKDRLEGPEGPE